jgi:hypothetical protein
MNWSLTILVLSVALLTFTYWWLRREKSNNLTKDKEEKEL